MCEGEMEAPAREIVIEFKNSEINPGIQSGSQPMF